MGVLLRRRICKPIKEELVIERLPTGVSTWTVPERVKSVDVFLVGGGGLGGGWYQGGGGGAGGQCVTQLNVAVTPGEIIDVVVGNTMTNTKFGDIVALAGRRGLNGSTSTTVSAGGEAWPGSGAGGQGGIYTTAGTNPGEASVDFFGKKNAGGGGGGGQLGNGKSGGKTDYIEGSGGDGNSGAGGSGGKGGGGYGGGGGGGGGGGYGLIGDQGGDGTILIRYYSRI